MSCIAGILLSDGASDPSASLVSGLDRLLDALEHRGSHALGKWQGPGCVLGARVFASTPESIPERQPLVDPQSGCVLVWDGRLDNRDELLDALAAPGEEPTDAELALRAFGRWGEGCAERLIGDFGFAIWNPRNRTLYAARDPLGLRPFFYYADATRFYFASELQALLRLPEVPRELDELTISEYLLWWTDFPQPERTFYRALRRLLPAHWLRWSPQGLKVHRYWQIDPHRQLHYRRHEEYVEEFHWLFSRAVSSRMRARTPIGISLSGGMDSSSVASLAARHADSCGPLRAYCAPLLGPRDESAWAELVAREAGIAFRRFPYFPPSYVEGLWACIRRLAMPFVDEGWAVDETLLETAAADGVGVILTGDGGDEIFGYPWPYMARLFRGFRFQKLRREWGPYARYYQMSPINLLQYVGPYLVPKSVIGTWKILKWRQPPRWINPDLARRTQLLQRLRQVHPSVLWRSDDVQQALYALTRGRMILFLERRELAAIRWGAEYRYPFYDRRLLEFMLAVPWHEKITAAGAKSFLREAPALLPQKMCSLQEKGDYRHIVEARMRHQDHAVLRELFRQPSPEASAYVDLHVARSICDDYLAGNDRLERATWSLACFLLWVRNFVPGAGIPLEQVSTALGISH